MREKHARSPGAAASGADVSHAALLSPFELTAMLTASTLE
jgi:hypothetical protein